MKIIVTNRWLKDACPNSLEERAKLFESTLGWFKKHQEKGTCLHAYSDILGESIVSIWDIPYDQCIAINLDCPFTSYMSVDYIAAVELDVVCNQLTQK